MRCERKRSSLWSSEDIACPPNAGEAALVPKSRADEARHASRGMTRLDEVTFDRVLVPFEPHTRHIGNVQLPVLELVWSLENRIRPILPFEPMRSLGDAHHVSSDLRIE